TNSGFTGFAEARATLPGLSELAPDTVELSMKLGHAIERERRGEATDFETHVSSFGSLRRAKVPPVRDSRMPKRERITSRSDRQGSAISAISFSAGRRG